MERLTDEQLQALRRFYGERMHGTKELLVDTYNALDELVELRQKIKEKPND